MPAAFSAAGRGAAGSAVPAVPAVPAAPIVFAVFAVSAVSALSVVSAAGRWAWACGAGVSRSGVSAAGLPPAYGSRVGGSAKGVNGAKFVVARVMPRRPVARSGIDLAIVSRSTPRAWAAISTMASSVPTTIVPRLIPPDATLMIRPNAKTAASSASTVSASNIRRVHCSRWPGPPPGWRISRNAAMYSRTPMPEARTSTPKPTRKSTGSMPVNLPRPAQTPVIMRPSLERLSTFSGSGVPGESGAGVGGASVMVPSWPRAPCPCHRGNP